MAEERVDVALIAAHFDTIDAGGRDVVLTDQPQRGIHHRLLDRAAGKPLDQIAWRGKHPRAAEAVDDRARIEPAAGGLEEPERRFEHVVCRRRAERREIGGDRPLSAACPA